MQGKLKFTTASFEQCFAHPIAHVNMAGGFD
jgi:hypothetical protein